MRYSIRQETRYEYDYTVAASQHTIRLIPAIRPGLRVISGELQIRPEPAERHVHGDFFGNRVVSIAFDAPHQQLDVVMESEVEVEGWAEPDAEGTLAWEACSDLTAASLDMGRDSPIHGLFPSRGIQVADAITTYAAASFTPGRPILAACFDFARRIHDEFAYEPGATDVTTSPAEAFARRRGVCQDFAQVMIAGLRGLGLPALYVSGYLRTIPPPGRARLEGADETHAWVAAWCGPGAGWIGLDPTNAVMTGEDHITAAIGRDYLDVAPIGGVIISAGKHHLTSRVDVIPIDTPGGM